LIRAVTKVLSESPKGASFPRTLPSSKDSEGDEMAPIFACLSKKLRFAMGMLPILMIGCSSQSDFKVLDFKGARLGMTQAEVRTIFPDLHPLPVDFGLAADKPRFQWYGCTDEDEDAANDCGPFITIANSVPRQAKFLFSDDRLILLDVVFDKASVKQVQADLEDKLGTADGEPGNKTLRDKLTGTESVGTGVIWLSEHDARIGLANYKQKGNTYLPLGELILADQRKVKKLNTELRQAGRRDELLFFEEK
jgi:hypothetical protein